MWGIMDYRYPPFTEFCVDQNKINRCKEFLLYLFGLNIAYRRSQSTGLMMGIWVHVIIWHIRHSIFSFSELMSLHRLVLSVLFQRNSLSELRVIRNSFYQVDDHIINIPFTSLYANHMSIVPDLTHLCSLVIPSSR